MDGEDVYIGNNNLCPVIGFAIVTLKLKNGKLVDLTNIRCVPGLRRNLISLGTLDDHGCTMKVNEVLQVNRGVTIVLYGKISPMVYMFLKALVVRLVEGMY